MNKCESCAHYDACKSLYEILMDGRELQDHEECEHFKDRSRFVELPCAVGTVVYEIMNNTDACLDCDYRYFSYTYDDEECERPGHQTNNPSLAKYPVCEKQFMEVINFPATERYLLNNRDKFGKTVFLTLEEAEAELARRTANG